MFTGGTAHRAGTQRVGAAWPGARFPGASVALVREVTRKALSALNECGDEDGVW